MSPDDAAETLGTVALSSRHAEIFAYDEPANQFSLVYPC